MSEPQMPPAPSRNSTWPGPGSGTDAGSRRRSLTPWILQSIIDELISLPIPALAESLGRAVQMRMHRGARGIGVAALYRFEYRLVLADRGRPQFRRVEM